MLPNFSRPFLPDSSKELVIISVPLTKSNFHDGSRKITGSITSGFSDDTQIARDAENRILGKVNHRFHNTRDAHGTLASVDTADAGLLIGGDDE